MANLILNLCFWCLPALAADLPYFPDLNLRDQTGTERRFYSHLVKRNIVVIHSFFGACHGACPVILSRVKYLQDHLAAGKGAPVVFLSITVDPDQDQAGGLTELAASLNAGPNWYFLYGPKQNVDWILYKLGQYALKKEDHSTLIIIGNEPTGQWAKIDASAPPEQILKLLQTISGSNQ